MIEVIDEKTGEIKMMRYGEVLRPTVPFRSRTDLKGFNDDEVYEPNTSLTDPSQVLDISETVKRMLRGEIDIPGVSADQYDIVLDEHGNPVNMTIDEAFDTEDITRQPDFDYADAAMIKNELEEAHLSTLPTSASRGAAKSKASDDGEPVVDNVGQIELDNIEETK